MLMVPTAADSSSLAYLLLGHPAELWQDHPHAITLCALALLQSHTKYACGQARA